MGLRENETVLKIKPIDTLVRRRGYYFSKALVIGVGVSVLMLFEYWKTLGMGIVLLTFSLGFVLSYLIDRIPPIRKTFNFVYNGIVVTDKKIVLYGYYPRYIARTISRNKVCACYLKINTKEKSENLLQALKTWLFWTPKSLVLLGEHGEKVVAINASLYKDEDIQKLIAVLGAKSPQ